MAITIPGSAAVTAQSAGAQALSLQRVTISAGAPEGAHLHERHETALYLLRGTLVVFHGDWLQEHAVVRPGEYFYLPAGVAHAMRALDPAEPCVALVARTDPNEAEASVLLAELDPLLDERASSVDRAA
jgi:uncharacterized RmlC-like cupin family protein